jgi:hypothetical protein
MSSDTQNRASGDIQNWAALGCGHGGGDGGGNDPSNVRWRKRCGREPAPGLVPGDGERSDAGEDGVQPLPIHPHVAWRRMRAGEGEDHAAPGLGRDGVGRLARRGGRLRGRFQHRRGLRNCMSNRPKWGKIENKKFTKHENTRRRPHRHRHMGGVRPAEDGHGPSRLAGSHVRPGRLGRALNGAASIERFALHRRTAAAARTVTPPPAFSRPKRLPYRRGNTVASGTAAVPTTRYSR